MSVVAAQPRDWSRGKFLLLVAVVLVGQVVLVALLAARIHPPSPPSASHAVFTALPSALNGETLAKYVFAIDPTVFPFSSPHGFEDRAWDRLPKQEVRLPRRSQPPAFLEFAARPSTPNLAYPERALPKIPFELAGRFGPDLEDEAVGSGEEVGRKKSFFGIAGESVSNLLVPPADLGEWANTPVLTNTVIQFAVNRAGQVYSVSLIGGSGFDAADAAAVSLVWNWRFVPSRQPRTPSAWDVATFYWKTVPPLGTNAPPTSITPAAP
jgi:TonB family protein